MLSSPALDAGFKLWQRLLLALLHRWLPDIRLGNGLDPTYLTHDHQIVVDYKADRLVHDRISVRLARFIAEAGEATLATAPSWSVPTLLLFAGTDRLVNPDGSRRFAKAAPPEVLTSQCLKICTTSAERGRHPAGAVHIAALAGPALLDQ